MVLCVRVCVRVERLVLIGRVARGEDVMQVVWMSGCLSDVALRAGDANVVCCVRAS